MSDRKRDSKEQQAKSNASGSNTQNLEEAKINRGWTMTDQFHLRTNKHILRVVGNVCGYLFSSFTIDTAETILIEFLVVWLVWAILWTFLKANAMPGTYVFGVAILTSVSFTIKAFISTFTNLFPGHYMTFVGLLARNTFLPELQYMKSSYPMQLDYTKRMSYVVFLLRAGLGTNLVHVKQNSTLIFRLLCIHSLIKTSYVCFVTKFALDIPWEWASLAGVMFEPSSPVLMFTTVTLLRSQGYSPRHEIHSTVIFSTIIDSLLSLCCSITFIEQAGSTRGWWGAPLVYIPAQVVIGIAVGLTVGFIGIYVPSDNNAHADIYRCLYFVTSSFFFILSTPDNFIGAGFIAAYLSPLVATTGWKYLNYHISVVRMRNVTSLLWSWTQPFLFSLIGAEIEIKLLGEKRRLIFIGIYFGALLIDIGASLLATLKAGYPWKLRFLLWLCKIPKGSIDVAVGFWIKLTVDTYFPNDEIRSDYAQLVTDCCVLGHFISGPIGGTAFYWLARSVLKKDTPSEGTDPSGRDDDNIQGRVNLPSEPTKGRLSQSLKIV